MQHELYEQHQLIRDAAQALMDGVLSVPRIDAEELNRLRIELCVAIKRHRITEDALIFRPLARLGGFADRPELRAAIAVNQAAKDRYAETVERWPPEAVEADWDGYVAAVADHFIALDGMIRDEEEQIYHPVLSLLGLQSEAA